MRLNRSPVAATLPALGETEASSAGEQLAKGYPSRAVTGLRRGEALGPPHPHPVIVRLCLKKLPPKAERMGGRPRPAKVARISGKMWPYFAERAW